MQIFGGYGYIHNEYMIERIWRDLRVARVYDGSSEVQQIVIARPPAQGGRADGMAVSRSVPLRGAWPVWPRQAPRLGNNNQPSGVPVRRSVAG